MRTLFNFRRSGTLQEYRKALKKWSTLDVFRNGLKIILGTKFALYRFRPASALEPKRVAEYEANILAFTEIGTSRKEELARRGKFATMRNAFGTGSGWRRRDIHSAIPDQEQEIMTIAAGDKIPAVTFRVMTDEGPKPLSSGEVFGGKKVVMFIVPGAFTPGCSVTHLPGYVVKADEIKAKGVDTIACLAVNDAFVMGAWGKSQNADELLMLADGNGEFAAAAGLEVDFSGFGMGGRAKRCAMIVDDGTVTHIAIEPGGGIGVSSAEAILEQL